MREIDFSNFSTLVVEHEYAKKRETTFKDGLTMDIVRGPSLHEIVTAIGLPSEVFRGLQRESLSCTFTFNFCEAVLTRGKYFTHVTTPCEYPVVVVGLHRFDAETCQLTGYFPSRSANRTLDPSISPYLVFGNYNVKRRTGSVTLLPPFLDYIVGEYAAH